MYEVKAYRCEFCKKYGLSKGWIKKHEQKCFRNPVTRSCSTCANRTSNRKDLPEFGYFKEVPYCLEAISMKPMVFNPDNEDKVQFHTNCAKWVERPEEYEELILFQRGKEMKNVNTIIADILNADEYPF